LNRDPCRWRVAGRDVFPGADVSIASPERGGANETGHAPRSRPSRDGARPLRLRTSWALLGLLITSACASTRGGDFRLPSQQRTGDIPGDVRPGFGNAAFHTWWPLTPSEEAALRGLDDARRGDARALLALAVTASGDRRDAASYAAFQRRIDQFVAQVRPAMLAARDEWHRGYELHRAMHRLFFAGGAAELGGYAVDQARVTGIFGSGRYNCLSSTMLFLVLARSFDLPVRAAAVPTHVFVELGKPGEKVIEIETTSATGFDWVHDARFFREQAASWSGQRGLRPTTLAEYQHRRILQPHQLISLAMLDAHSGTGEADRNRLDELADIVDPTAPDAQRARIDAYGNEANALFDRRAWRTMVQLFDFVGPSVARIAATTKDPKTLEVAWFTTWYHAYALMIEGRPDESLALMDTGLAHLDPAWGQATALRNNLVGLLVSRLAELIDRHDYPAAAATFTKHRDACLSETTCANDAGIVYVNWSIDRQNGGDWLAARQILQDCTRQLPGDGRCREQLTELEGRHRF